MLSAGEKSLPHCITFFYLPIKPSPYVYWMSGCTAGRHEYQKIHKGLEKVQ
jgi:hypothetical protein